MQKSPYKLNDTPIFHEKKDIFHDLANINTTIIYIFNVILHPTLIQNEVNCTPYYIYKTIKQ